ncbi:MAG: DUF3450 domain-containing protein [Alphaproteobacteria bacterium]
MTRKSMTGRTRMSALAIAAALGFTGLMASGPAQAGKELDNLIKYRDLTLQQHAQSQGRIDSYDDQRSEALTEYKATLKKLAALKEYNAQLEGFIADQERQLVSLEEQIERVTGINREIQPLMTRMLDGLKAFVDLDVPFLPDERADRLSTLDGIMENSNLSPAERYRKVAEAYQIENEYGRTIEAYQGDAEIDGQSRTMDFLRVGRIVFIAKALDNSEYKLWNQKTGSWEDLDDGYSSQVLRAFRIARKQEAPDLMILPVAAPEAAK